jgi:hypothetical protein
VPVIKLLTFHTNVFHSKKTFRSPSTPDETFVLSHLALNSRQCKNTYIVGEWSRGSIGGRLQQDDDFGEAKDPRTCAGEETLHATALLLRWTEKERWRKLHPIILLKPKIS